MVPFCRSCHKMAVSFNPYQANHILRTRKGAGESSPVDMTSMYQRLHRGAKAVHTCTHVSFKTMVALKGDRLPQHSRLAGTDARRKAQGCTRAQPVAPEAVDALTLLMWQATEHREAGFSRTPPPLHHVIGRAQRLGQGAFSLETLSVDAQNQTLEAFLATTLRFWSRCTPTPPTHHHQVQPAPTGCCRRTKRPCAVCRLERKTGDSVRPFCHRFTSTRRKTRCDVLEITSWKDYNETHNFSHSHPLTPSSPWRGGRGAGRERDIRSWTESPTWYVFSNGASKRHGEALACSCYWYEVQG